MTSPSEDVVADLPEVSSMYDEAKTAQMAAFFLKMGGGRMEYIKIIKLLYLAEREHLNLYHSPMTGDRLYSLRKGPIVSITYNCIKKEACGKGKIWHKWISEKDGYLISLQNGFKNVEELDELSAADLEIVSDIWKRFGWMNWTQLIRYTHFNCPEWKHPGRSSTPIEYSDVLKALGYRPEKIARIEASIRENESSPKFASIS